MAQVLVDNGSIAAQIHDKPSDKVLELVDTTTSTDSLQCAREAGIVGNKWSLDVFSPIGKIPTSVSLTTYAGESEDFMKTPLEDLVQRIERGRMHVQIGKVFSLDEIVEAHR